MYTQKKPHPLKYTTILEVLSSDFFCNKCFILSFRMLTNSESFANSSYSHPSLQAPFMPLDMKPPFSYGAQFPTGNYSFIYNKNATCIVLLRVVSVNSIL